MNAQKLYSDLMNREERPHCTAPEFNLWMVRETIMACASVCGRDCAEAVLSDLDMPSIGE